MEVKSETKKSNKRQNRTEDEETESQKKKHKHNKRRKHDKQDKKVRGDPAANIAEGLIADQLAFFKACCKSLRRVKSLAKLKRHATKITKLVSEDGRVETYLLPESVTKWPSFRANKQREEQCKELYFKRVADSNGPRFNETVELLRARKQVISTGLSGIGKSTEVNGLLMAFLPRLGAAGWPKQLWYRYDNLMLQYSLNPSTKEPQVAVVAAKTISDVLELTQRFCEVETIEDLPVLLLEMEEDEVQPKSWVPTYIPLSNRNAYETTKSMGKAHAVYLLVDLPSSEDVQTMAATEAYLHPDLLFAEQMGTNGEASEKVQASAKVRALMKDRVEILGPRLRDIFVTSDEYESNQVNIKTCVPNFIRELSKVSVWNMPPNARFFLGAKVRPEFNAVVPYLNRGVIVWTIDFLSDHIRTIVAEECTAELRSVLEKQENFDYLIAEGIVRHALMQRTCTDDPKDPWRLDKWEFFRNPSQGEKRLWSEHGIDRPDDIDLCTAVVRFPETILRVDVTELKALTLYSSNRHNGVLYDFLLVNHTAKKVYLFQSSNLRASAHALDYSHLKEVIMTGLELGKHPEYSVTYVYCGDNSRIAEGALVISNKDNLPESETNSIDARLTLLIARVCYYPKLAAVPVPAKPAVVPDIAWGREHPDLGKQKRVSWSPAEVEYIAGWRQEHPLGTAADCCRAVKGDAAAHPIFHRSHMKTSKTFESQLKIIDASVK